MMNLFKKTPVEPGSPPPPQDGWEGIPEGKRLRVPGGWVYMLNVPRMYEVATVFVPDPAVWQGRPPTAPELPPVSSDRVVSARSELQTRILAFGAACRTAPMDDQGCELVTDRLNALLVGVNVYEAALRQKDA